MALVRPGQSARLEAAMSWDSPRLLAAGDDDLAPRPGDRDLARSQVLEAHLTTGTAMSVQAEYRSRFLNLLDTSPLSLTRACLPSHLTGSALVVRPGSDECLLLWHNKAQRWLQPGGHADGDGNLAHVAWREATEETGIAGLRVVVPAVHLDIHEFRPVGEPLHMHFDVRFIVAAPADAVPRGNHESSGFRWATVAQLGDLGADAGLIELARWGQHLMNDPNRPDDDAGGL